MGEGMGARLTAGMMATAALIAGLLTAGAVSAYAAGFVQGPRSPLYSSGATGELALGDLNGDGRADVVVTDPVSGRLVVLLGSGGGMLVPAPAAPAVGATKPASVLTTDLNADGKVDVVVSDEASRNLWVLLGDGTGALSAGKPYATGGSRRGSLTAGDFNGDAKPDIAVVHLAGGDMSVMLGNGLGALTRSPGSPFSTGGTHPGPSAAGDFNGDGNLDVAVGNESGNVAVMLGDGAGGLVRGGGSPFGLAPAALGAGDFNGDGRLDVAVANTTGSVSILLGSGTGSLGPLPPPVPVIRAGTAPAALAIADIDLDGRLDLAVANAGSGDVSVLLGNGSAGFAAAPGTPVSTGGSSPSSLATGDMNGDGKPDLTVVNAASTTISVLLNGVALPSAAFVSYPALPVIGQEVTFAYSSPGGIQALDWDLNGDGVFDDAHGPTAVRIFAAPGAYPITLRVTDIDGVISTGTRLISVGVPAGPSPVNRIGAPSRPQLMAPFPIVRITGRTAPHGARIKALEVVAPRGAKVTVRCGGKGCPFRRWQRAVGSKALVVGKLSGRYLRAGVTLEVRVYKSGAIGKFTRMVIRKQKAPARNDLCLLPGSSAGSRCPST
jgi:hypothetical protein